MDGVCTHIYYHRWRGVETESALSKLIHRPEAAVAAVDAAQDGVYQGIFNPLVK